MIGDTSSAQFQTGDTEPGLRNGTQLREHELPDGALAVSSHWVHGVKDSVRVPTEKRDLYELLKDVLTSKRIPDTMPAQLAIHCQSLVDVRDAVSKINRGGAIVGDVKYSMSYCYRVRDAIEDHRDREPLTLVAVGCSGSKHRDEEPMPAKDRYNSGYWTCKQRYGETISDSWRIISAEHAVLDPETQIEYYERTPEDLEGIPIDSPNRLPTGQGVNTLLDQWALDVYCALQRWIDSVGVGVDPRDIDLEILLGRKYRTPLEQRGVFDALRSQGELRIRFPFQENQSAQGGQGFQMQWLNSMVESRT
jgi:hypothetical protein